MDGQAASASLMSRLPGRRRLLLGYPAHNMLLANLAFQTLLLVGYTGLSTFLCQLLNVALGFVL
jgi:hypothetical protein